MQQNCSSTAHHSSIALAKRYFTDLAGDARMVQIERLWGEKYGVLEHSAREELCVTKVRTIDRFDTCAFLGAQHEASISGSARRKLVETSA